MGTRTIVMCAFATAVLGASVNVAASAELRARLGVRHWHGYARHSAAHARVVHHYGVHPDATRAGAQQATVHASTSPGSDLQSGIASIYSGERTANGEYASASGLTAAHRTLPFGTMVKVTNKQTGRSVVVRINDRGPFVRGRVIDLTPAGAKAIGCSGLAPVTLAVVGRG